ncbi:MAG: RagB/SusD family nutrient uptake outer membrane protein [Chitinophagaceae bacterium]
MRPASLPSTGRYIDISASINGNPNAVRLSNDTFGEVTYLNTVTRKWDDKKYYYPIPEADITANPNLKQNAGW